jgi:hypothetical protein
MYNWENTTTTFLGIADNNDNSRKCATTDSQNNSMCPEAQMADYVNYDTSSWNR